jgi:4-diphosphocytidyl-2-C-methyl-D-erythritol kinase
LEKISLKAPAKINLYLRVLRKRDDGFHEIETLMQAIDFYDEISLEESATLELSCDDPTIPRDADNLALKAAILMRERYPFPGVSIRLSKQIPVGGGLGGGSSDAAFVMRGLCELFGISPPIEEMKALASKIGSDVPFFLTNGQALATGRGEVLCPVHLPLDYAILLVIPPMSISTAQIYGALKINLTGQHENFLLDNTVDLSKLLFLANRFGNDLETPVLFKFPELGEIKRSLLGTGAFHSLMSGSGSVFYGLFSKDIGIPSEYENLVKLGCSLVRCKPILLPPFGI